LCTSIISPLEIPLVPASLDTDTIRSKLVSVKRKEWEYFLVNYLS
jgi:hypothetical protein